MSLIQNTTRVLVSNYLPRILRNKNGYNRWNFADFCIPLPLEKAAILGCISGVNTITINRLEERSIRLKLI